MGVSKKNTKKKGKERGKVKKAKSRGESEKIKLDEKDDDRGKRPRGR